MKPKPQTLQELAALYGNLEACEQVVFIRLTQAIYDFKLVHFGEFDLRSH